MSANDPIEALAQERAVRRQALIAWNRRAEKAEALNADLLAAARKASENLDAALHGRPLVHSDLVLANALRVAIAKATRGAP